jgi:hypothetical protein
MPERGAVVHGDFRLGNLMAARASVNAVIDWEIWSIGDPRIDAGLVPDQLRPDARGRSWTKPPGPWIAYPHRIKRFWQYIPKPSQFFSNGRPRSAGFVNSDGPSTVSNWPSVGGSGG